MSKKKFNFIDLSDDLYIEENVVNHEDFLLEEQKKEEVVEIKPQLPPIQEIKIETSETKIKEPIIPPTEIPKQPKKEFSLKSTKTSDMFFKEKEKLDIKTNIYLKKDNYQKIEQIYKNTGNSRSSIINKLIEIALGKIEEDN
ncbi:MAG: hypothetical protein ACRCVI_00705 [Mycoplasmoidaceae bacterium]